MEIPKRRSDKFRKLQDDGPIHLTKEGFRLLKEKLEHLKSIQPALITRTKQAAECGDRSDNDEYKEAKMLLRRTQGQILNIEYQIKRVVVIDSGPNISGKVQIGSTVILETNGTRKTFQILGSHESDPSNGRISFKSPLGAALIDHKKGDTVTVETKGGSQKYFILEVK
ncbi:MAG: transcription elongation factor GreA [Candidatus Pacebacteria bacterium]|nr:transcription elongation factor GreA [Candidatus Paceibacterota bacterium]